MRVSRKGAKFVAGWEGFRSQPYNDAAGHCTRGYGELIHYGPCKGNEASIGEREARSDLRRDLNRVYGPAVKNLINRRLRQHEYDALTAFTFNVGIGALSSSTLRRRLNEGDAFKRVVREELPKWNKAGGKPVAGLTARRNAEVRLAIHGDYSGRP